MLRSKIIAAVACLGIILAGTGELAFGETAEVLPKGISRVNVMYSYYQPIDQRFDSDGNTEDVDSDFNFPISAALIGGSISSIVGDAVVDRAGNAAMEEIVMALRTRSDVFGVNCGIDSRQIMDTSRMVSEITGYPVPRNKAIVGTDALKYDTGILQSGFSKQESYEMIKAEDIGLQ